MKHKHADLIHAWADADGKITDRFFTEEEGGDCIKLEWSRTEFPE